MSLLRSWQEVVIREGWLAGRLLADLCAETRLDAGEVMMRVRLLGLPDRHPTTRARSLDGFERGERQAVPPP